MSAPPRSSVRTWTATVAYGLVAYAAHKVGATLGYYQVFGWFQLLTHFLSATAVALVLVRAGRTLGVEGRRLLAFVVGLSTVAAAGWELVEYLGLLPWLHWWGPADSAIDATMDALGVATVVGLRRKGWWPFGRAARPSSGE